MGECGVRDQASGRVTLLLAENQQRETALLSAEQAQTINKYAGQFLEVRPGWGGMIQLKAKQYIGTLVFDNVTVRVLPKVPVENLFYMLTFAYDLPKFRERETGLTASSDIFPFIVEIFRRQVDRLIRFGIYRQYVARNESQRFLRGRLNVVQQLRRQPAIADRFHQELSEYTADVLENQLLKRVLWQLTRTPQLGEKLRRGMRRTLSAFSDVSLLSLSAVDCDRVLYNRLNASYHSPIQLAKLLLQHLSVEGRAGDTPFASFMLPMYQVFELFVARYLADAFRDHPTLSVEIQPDIWLDAALSDKGRPDIILRHENKRVMVIDTKYKTFENRPNPGDRNQMVTYCHTMGLRHALLTYADPRPVTSSNRYGDVSLYANALNLQGDLETFKQSHIAYVQRIVERLPSISVVEP